jgi:hypothetical protein
MGAARDGYGNERRRIVSGAIRCDQSRCGNTERLADDEYNDVLGLLNPKNPSHSFALTLGAGTARATLSFTKCPALSLALQRSDGSTVANATGASVLILDANVNSGPYTYTVSG